MLRSLLDDRRNNVVKDVWEQERADIMERAGDTVEQLVEWHSISPVKAPDGVRCVRFSYDRNDEVLAKFAVPFSGDTAVVRHVQEGSAHMCGILDPDEPADGWSPGAPPADSLVVRVYGRYTNAADHFEREFGRRLASVCRRLKKANAEIEEFNALLPKLVRRTVEDRLDKMRHVDILLDALAPQDMEAA